MTFSLPYHAAPDPDPVRHTSKSHALLTPVSSFAGLQRSSCLRAESTDVLLQIVPTVHARPTYSASCFLLVYELVSTLQPLVLSSHSSVCKRQVPSTDAPFLYLQPHECAPSALIFHQGVISADPGNCSSVVIVL